MSLDIMRFSVTGPDLAALTTAITKLPVFATPPTSVDVDRVKQPGTADWLTRWLPHAKDILAAWDDGSRLWHSRSSVLAISRSFADDLPGLARFVAGLPFELAAFWSPHGAHWAAAGFRPRGFGRGHIQNGWGAMFKGAGHDYLVSRRWLEHGPWKLTRHPGDVSQLEFYDHRVDADTAMAQAKRASDRLGGSPTGGYLQKPYVYLNKLDGMYDAQTRTFKVPVAVRKLKQSEMLDACGLRAERRHDPEAPIEQAGFVFVMGPDEATPYLHELWLRELGCWAVVDGVDVRLDEDYTPPPVEPPWPGAGPAPRASAARPDSAAAGSDAINERERSEHELNAAILAAPGDDAPRRALAAFHDARGNPHGELIRIQLELADPAIRGTEPEGRLLIREDQLLKAHGRAWAAASLADLADLITGYRFHRGLIGEVTVPLDRFLDVAPALFATAPIQHLNLTPPRTRFAELLSSPHLVRLISLSFDRIGLDDEDARAIAGTAAMGTLRWLSLARNRIGRPGVEALAASPWLTRLAVLDLFKNPCDPTPRPAAYELDGRVTAIDRPPVADELVAAFGPRPWLANPADPDRWPVPRDAYR